MLKIIPCERRTYVVEAFIYFNHQNLKILRMDFFPLKCSSSSYYRVCVSYIALSFLQWVFTIRLSLILPQNIQISGQFLELMNYMPLLILALVQGLEIFLSVKELWFYYLLCDKYFVYVV